MTLLDAPAVTTAAPHHPGSGVVAAEDASALAGSLAAVAYGSFALLQPTPLAEIRPLSAVASLLRAAAPTPAPSDPASAVRDAIPAPRQATASEAIAEPTGHESTPEAVEHSAEEPALDVPEVATPVLAPVQEGPSAASTDVDAVDEAAARAQKTGQGPGGLTARTIALPLGPQTVCAVPSGDVAPLAASPEADVPSSTIDAALASPAVKASDHGQGALLDGESLEATPIPAVDTTAGESSNAHAAEAATGDDQSHRAVVPGSGAVPVREGVAAVQSPQTEPPTARRQSVLREISFLGE